jgi:hypothetical protein
VWIDGCNAAKNNKIAMEHLQAADLLRFAEKEAEMLQQMQVKISNELHRLQVEEELFVRTMERLKENSKKSNKMQVKCILLKSTRWIFLTSFQLHSVNFH